MAENFVYIGEDITEEEREKIKKEFETNLKWAQSLTKEQINFLMDAGYYNNAIKGYVIAAAKNADITDAEQIKNLLCGVNCALDDKDKKDAENLYINYKG